MELQGKVIVVLPERSGTSARGEWKAQSYVIETHEAFPKQMVFDVFGQDRIAQFAIKSGDEINVSFDITAHEYQGRWFNSIRAWQVMHVDPNAAQGMNANMQQGPMPTPQAAPAGAPAASPQAPFAAQPENGGSQDDLPF